MQKPPLLPHVPGYAAASLVICSFLLGHFSQQAHDVQRAQLGQAPDHGDRHLLRRQLHIQTADTVAAPVTTSTSKASIVDTPGSGILPPANPLDTAALENYMLESSGLLKVRPAIPSALSGDAFTRVIPFQILSWAPCMVVFPAFVDPERCRIICAYAAKQLTKSALAYRPGEKEDQSGQQTRTSSGTFLASMHEPTGSLAWVEERIAAAALMPVANGEPFNLLKYEHMQHYDSHMDSFDPKEYGPQNSQRVATILIYLSDVLEGGETIFKKEGRGNGSRVITEWRTCDDGIGYKYKPRMGDAVLFYDTLLNGDIDAHALHGGCPVKSGEKWVMTKWLRNKPMLPDTAAELEMFAKAAKEQHL